MRYALAAFYVNGNNPMLKVISRAQCQVNSLSPSASFSFHSVPVRYPQQHALLRKTSRFAL
jgi:hypothetical protein